MMSYINETDFVIENKKLVYPEIVADGLQLYYDAKGKRDTDYHRDTMLDMSGNKNHGKLHNFAYEKHSGYKDGLVFDYIDDKLVRPTLDLQPDDFTFMLNGNIISFSPDGTVKRVQDGEVIESKGFNLVRNGDFRDGLAGWSVIAGTLSLTETEYNSFPNSFYKPAPTDALYRDVSLPNNHLVYLSAFVKGTNKMELRMHQYKTWTRIKVVTIESSDEWTLLSLTGLSNNGGIRIDTSVSDGENYYDDFIVIDLTETFGAGKEPTKEEMDAIINRFGYIPNAQDLIDHIEYKGNDLGDMENIIDGLYKTEVLSGEEVYTDKADDSVVHVEVDGESVGGGSGKNLVELNLLEKPSRIRVEYPLDKLKPGIAYYASFKNKDYTFWNGGGWVSEGPINDHMINKGVVTIRKGTGNSGAGEEYTVGELIKDGLFQIEEGSVATAYEPPAPTPDYPVEIHNLNDFDVVSSVGKENLFSLNKFTNTGVISKINNGFRITNSYGTIITSYTKPDIKPGKTYTISGEITVLEGTSTFVTGRFIMISKDTNSVPNLLLYSGRDEKFSNTFIVPNDFNYSNYHGLYAYGIRDGVVEFVNIKIEEGSVDTPYTPSLEEVENDNHPLIDKINLLLSEPLRSVDDIKDRLFRDSDGVWKIERRVGETIVGPTVNFAMGASTGGWKVDGNTIPFYGYGEPSSNNQPSLTNKFKTSVGSWIVGSDLEGFSSGYRNFYIFRINKDRLDTVDSAGFKKWLEVNPVKVLYVLNTSITETLSQPLQDKLNNIRSFEDSNYVYIVDGSTNLLDTVPLLNNHWYPSSGTLQNPVTQNGHTSTQEPLPVYPGAKIHLTKETTVDNYWRIVWVDKDNNVVIREVSTVNDLVLTAPNGAYGMRVSYPNGSNPVIKFDKSGITQTVSNNLRPTLHAKFLYNNWYKEDRVINNLMIYNRALTNEEMLQNYKTIKRRWGM